MGRPWWYDSYWEKNKKTRRRRPRLPGGSLWIWIILLALVAAITLWRTLR